MIDTMMQIMQLGVEWVLYLLIGLSILTLALALERAWFLIRNRTRYAQLRGILERVLDGDDRAEEELRTIPGPAAELLLALHDRSDLSPEALQELAEGLLIEQKGRLEKRLDFFATAGSNAPFIGLFGTVLGIVKAFADLAAAETTGPQIVMAGISEALVATAVGLGVAIPCLVLFNVFKGRARDGMRQTEALAKVLMSHRVENAVVSLMTRTAHRPQLKVREEARQNGG